MRHKYHICLTHGRNVSSGKWFDGSLYLCYLEYVGLLYTSYSTIRVRIRLTKEHFPINQNWLGNMIMKTWGPTVPVAIQYQTKIPI